MTVRRAGAVIAAVAVAVLVVAGCTDGGAGGGASGRDDEPTVTTGGAERSYVLVRPAGVTAPAPVVIVLHGARAAGLGSTIQSVLGLDDEAAAEGVVTVYPDGQPDLASWHAGCCYGEAADPVDRQFLSDLVDDLVAQGVADPAHVVVSGFSAGALLADDVGCTLGDKVSAIVSLSGAQLRPPAFVSQVVSPPIEPCAPARPVSRVEIHGLDDEEIEVGGTTDQCAASPCGPGQRGFLASATTADAWWRGIDGCAAPVVTEAPGAADGSTVSLASCRDGTVVGLAQIAGAGHSLGDLLHGFDVRTTILELATGRTLTGWGS